MFCPFRKYEKVIDSQGHKEERFSDCYEHRCAAWAVVGHKLRFPDESIQIRHNTLEPIYGCKIVETWSDGGVGKAWEDGKKRCN